MLPYLIHLAILILIYAILAISLNYIAGYTGITSFSQAAFLGIGAYTYAILTTTYQLNFFLASIFGVILALVISYLFSFPLLRTRKDSLVLVSIGFSIIVYNIFLNFTTLTGGALGIKSIPRPLFLNLDFSSNQYFLLLTLIAYTTIFFIFWKIVSSPYGTIIKGIRENDLVMEHHGYSVSSYKRSVFMLGSSFAALAGSLYASYFKFIEPNSFDLMTSVLILIMVIVGGMGNIKGSIFGAFLVIIFPEILRFVGLPTEIIAEAREILYGLMLILIIYYRPQGLLGEYKI